MQIWLRTVTSSTPKIRATSRVESPSILSGAQPVAGEISAYEIHMGNVERVADCAAPFRIVARNGAPTDLPDGAINRDGTVAFDRDGHSFERARLPAASSVVRLSGLGVPTLDQNRCM